MIITLDEKQITLTATSKVSFLDDITGMDVTEIPRQLNYNMETQGATVQAAGRYISPKFERIVFIGRDGIVANNI